MHIRIPSFEGVRVLVAGDVMLDRYWFGATSRISPEAPVPVVHVQSTEERPGGAGNVAVNLASLGVRCTVLGITGDDAVADSLAANMQKRGVECRFTRIRNASTTTKLRVLSRHQQLIRLDFEAGFGGQAGTPLLQDFKTALADTDAVILSDYGKGSLNGVQALIAAARDAGKTVLVDPKGRDFSKYRHASAITPNLAELEAVVGECPDQDAIVSKGEKLRAELGLQALLVTRGEHGMTLLESGKPPVHLPTQAQEVSDVTGAGDTVIALLAAGLGAKLDFPEAAALANFAAGLVVAKLGAASVTPPELRLAAHSRNGDGVLDEAAVMDAIAHARSQGERIVMTNGVFDILHAGHVAYLTEARRLGDRLIVAVNDDASVRRLKGENRPINPLRNRMQVLAALACVDWVVPFSEDTPERLICKLLPDILVKGGDYKPQQVAGYRCVTANGGQVRILQFLDGVSTTATIEKIRKH
ncbi:MAG: bifunctional D-glycero-beta-D-manno-heptose-7-phosphate kinase/D-glycero-beta-D-manno-heptose 1-phosphate adenylyltransferase HldE [Gammaproteobacteria bacterium]|nr:bifunctional D-glycero-beta-D-manno-heptose-7-phosphate kinase/D-glycero-beta-D-manno-heptose 1-phosphate adenylyltransferase HldE [Gammaproteobacteria bacterium]MDE2345494.1 bifunctional D-glycero-beta-D-manno-heptose-7-phosphate kinase/D-glycero-beta-D-manno-heptose 1-phosphate adenylyltransferase HldE [Gammaproteobacteria bacterium]